MFEQIGLIAKRQHAGASYTLQSVINLLRRRRLPMLLADNSVEALPQHGLPVANIAQLGLRCDLVIIIGGDGTFLQAARQLAEYDVHLLGVNLGRLGFLTDIHPDDLDNGLDAILNGHFIREQRFLLQARAYRSGQLLQQCNALNDVVIQKWNTPHMFCFSTSVDGHLLGTQRSDGLLIATPTGSTAYCLSGGGPILHPSLNALAILSMFPHTLSNPPMVVNGDSEIEVFICADQEMDAQLTCDAVLCQRLQAGDRLVVNKYHQVQLIHPQDHDYFATLRNKLHWWREP